MRLASPPLASRSLLAVESALLLVALLGCSGNPEATEATTVVFDGQSHTINGEITCTTQPDGRLVILVDGTGQNTVRVALRRNPRLVVEKVGLRVDDVSGYTDDSDNVWATKVDDAYEITGRMPPNDGRDTFHDFEIDTRCRYEATPSQPPPRVPRPPRIP